MEIISHRGFWIEPFEKNSINAFERSFHFKFGTETDVRDRDGKLVISHDCPNVDNMLFSTFLGIYNKFELKSTLAINIKSDGLQEKIKRELQYFNIENYFVFDMSIPDTILYLENEIKFLCRFSEYEKENDLWSNSNGIWYDNFKQEDKLNLSLIEGLILDRKKVCIVSSELHNRNNKKQWLDIKNLSNNILSSSDLILCTDLPMFAKEFFHAN